jgi:hypothetical protein
MLQTISIQILVNFGQTKVTKLNYKVCAGFGILEKKNCGRARLPVAHVGP